MTRTDCTHVTVNLADRSYPIYIGKGVIADMGREKALQSGRSFIVSDRIVWDLHGAGLGKILPDAPHFLIGQGETNKSQDTLFSILNWLLDNNAKRGDTVIAFGGGIVGDITGLAASMLKRGMKLVQVPTTLLAQVDSSVGGKTAINTPHGKNLIGAFYQPEAVYIDTDFLATLPPRQISAGLAEIIKYGVIRDPAIFDYILGNTTAIKALNPASISYLIQRSCEIKAEIVAADETERGQRALLNFGHTFGHALEVLNAYSDRLLHGEAVAIGMGLAARYSARLGLCAPDLSDHLNNAMSAMGLPIKATEVFDPLPTGAEVSAAMTQDKKANDKGLPLILTSGLGAAMIHPQTDVSDLNLFLESEFSA